MPVETETPAALDDIFIHDVPLPRRATFFPLGFPLEISTNSEAVIAAAKQSWGMFSLTYPGTPISICLTVTEDEDDHLPPRPKFRSHSHLMSIVADTRNQVICDLNQGCAFGWATRRVAESTEFLRLHLLDASVMTLLGQAHLAPIHSALIVRNGVGIALCGESHAGKSTLAYACARSGWTFVSDDGTFLLRDRADCYAIGNPYGIRFREDAKSLFPELAGCRIALRPNGSLGMEVRTSTLAVSTASGCSIDHMVFLRRPCSGAARMNRHDAADGLAWIEQRTAFYGPEDVQVSQRGAYRRLSGLWFWELHYSDLSDAIALLDGLA